MSSETDDLTRFLAEDCPECETPGYLRHLSVVGGCATCAAADPRPVNVPLRDSYAIEVFDMEMPAWPREYWKPFRNVFPRWHSGKACYPLPSGNMVHVKPGCRC